MESRKPIIVEAPDSESALKLAAQQLAVPETHLRLKKLEDKKFQAEIYAVPLKLLFQITPDKMRVVVSEVHPPGGAGGEPIHMEWTKGLMQLSQMKVRFGLNEMVLEKAIRLCVETNSVVKDVVVAQGKAPGPGIEAKLKFYFHPLKLTEIDASPVLKTAMAGDILLTKLKPVPGLCGINIFNEPVTGLPGPDAYIQIGPNIASREPPDSPSIDYVSKVYGLILFQNNRIDVLPTLRISEDKMSAHIDLVPFSCCSTPLSLPQVQAVLTNAKITMGVREKDLVEAIARCISQKTPLLNFEVAKGTAPLNGENGKFLVLLDRRMQSFQKPLSGLVAQGQILAELIPPTEPKNGFNILGKTLSAKKGTEYRFRLSKDVDVVEAKTRILKAGVSGYAVLKADSLEITPILEVARDEMTATFDFYPNLLDGSPLTTEFVLHSLAEAQITFGIQKEVIASTVEDVVSNSKPKLKVIVAKGINDIPGIDGWLEKLWEKKNPRISRFFTKKNEVVALVHPPTKGVAGHTVYNKEIRPTDGAPYRASFGEGLELISSKEPGTMQVISKKWGEILDEQEGRFSVQWEIEVADDKMLAHAPISRETALGATVEYCDILEAIKAQKIIFGIREAAIKELLGLKAAALLHTHFLIAEGKAPQTGSNARYEFKFSFNQLSDEALLDAGIHQVKEMQYLDIVEKNDVLVRLIPEGPGSPGQDIYGASINPIAGERAPELHIAEGVRFDSQTRAYVSAHKLAGYVSFVDKVLKIVSPFRIADDKLSGLVSVYPPNIKNGVAHRMLNVKDLAEWTQSSALKAVPDFAHFTEVVDSVAQFRKPKLDEVFIRGFTPENGKDEVAHMLVDSGRTAGRLRDDNSMNLKERNAIVSVKAGQEILSVNHATQGNRGEDLFGNPVECASGKSLTLNIGENVEKRESPEGYTLISKINGTLIYTDNTCSVIETFVVEGDVCYVSGNIHNESGGVVVKGSVRPDFEVTSNQDIVIEEVVENALIVSGTNAIVLGSVIGNHAEVRAGASAELGIVNNGHVTAHGKVKIRVECYQAHIKSNDSIVIENRSGRASGGELQALNLIDIPESGSAKYPVDTHLFVGKEFVTLKEVELQIKAEGLDSELKKVDEEIKRINDKIFRLSLSKPNRDPNFAKEVSRIKYNLDAFKNTKSELLERKTEFLSKVKQNPKAMIIIRGRVSPGTYIHIVDQTFFVKTPMNAMQFRLNAKGDLIIAENPSARTSYSFITRFNDSQRSFGILWIYENNT